MTTRTMTSLVILVLVTALAVGIIMQETRQEAVESFATLSSLDVINGEMHSPADLSRRPTLVVTWNTWCPSCIQEMRYLRDHYDEVRLRVNLVAVNLTSGERSLQALHEFLHEAELPFPVLADPEGRSRDRFASRYIPANFLLDTGGEIVNMMEGPMTLEILDQWLGGG